MNFKKKCWVSLMMSALLIGGVVLPGCTIKYSLSGASIPANAKTFSVAYFPNNAPMVAPILSSTFTDALQDRFVRQTRLTQVSEGGDLSFEGEIIGYTSTPAAISGDEYAVKNRLTITVKVRFTNALKPEDNFDKTFSQGLEYDSNVLLQTAEQTLIPEIVDMLVEDIFNAAVSNW